MIIARSSPTILLAALILVSIADVAIASDSGIMTIEGHIQGHPPGEHRVCIIHMSENGTNNNILECETSTFLKEINGTQSDRLYFKVDRTEASFSLEEPKDETVRTYLNFSAGQKVKVVLYPDNMSQEKAANYQNGLTTGIIGLVILVVIIAAIYMFFIKK